ncbi:sigma-70 family RNA polymerase sigma factor [Flavitalea sp. BT771]|uniref:RNA polymerase sigma factor n=1 Tax=Flavitalea sp. BT771 TaxID=3063329 RepID=UPI0026E11A4E|nr:sigma-70 family RNA polymerase sigma factor [Flavitalea sp. BT771]MDO6429850.1 sigma-70 family RNA polymerase sigma factor [Flavitalea sp. BT771]MDV6218022.1 sigma-70 family RNA polymerase sigma factor [Flavitalea sp. BT771]
MHTYPSYDEKALLSQVAQGDEAAFRIIFHSYHHKLGAYILKLTESFPLTEEIVQDVFLAIWQNRAGLGAINRFESYLFVIARNRAFNCLKQIARERMRKQEWANNRRDEPEEHGPHIAVGYDGLIEKAVDRLPPQQKKVYLLHNQQGMEYASIAVQMGLSATTVKKHMSLALRSIREYVHSHMDPVSILFVIVLRFFLL